MSFPDEFANIPSLGRIGLHVSTSEFKENNNVCMRILNGYMVNPIGGLSSIASGEPVTDYFQCSLS